MTAPGAKGAITDAAPEDADGDRAGGGLPGANIA